MIKPDKNKITNIVMNTKEASTKRLVSLKLTTSRNEEDFFTGL